MTREKNRRGDCRMVVLPAYFLSLSGLWPLAKGTKSILRASLAGVKVKSPGARRGCKSKWVKVAAYCGQPIFSLSLRTNLRGNGCLPSSTQSCQSASSWVKARCWQGRPPARCVPSRSPVLTSSSRAAQGSL